MKTTPIRRRRLPFRDSRLLAIPLAPAAVLILPVFTAPCWATDWYVDIANPACPGTGSAADPFCRISDAILAAQNLDTIHILPGHYLENLTIDKDLTLRGTGGWTTTLVDGGGPTALQSVLTIPSAVVVELRGLTLQNGFAPTSRGGGINSSAASLTLVDTRITRNGAGGDGGGVFATGTALTLMGSEITRNGCAGRGGGIYMSGGSVTAIQSGINDNSPNGVGGGIALDASALNLVRCTVGSNRQPTWLTSSYPAGGGIFATNSVLVIEFSLISGNSARACGSYGCFGQGGGISARGGTLEIANSVIADNYSQDSGGIYADTGSLTLEASTITRNTNFGSGDLMGSLNSTGSVMNSILWGSSSTPGIRSSHAVRYSNVEGGFPGTGNIDADPLFVNPANGDFRLSSTSPCIDAGDPASTPTGKDLYGNPRFLDGDLDGVMRVDMGAHEYSNVQLAITGNPTPGSQVTFDTTGTPGLAFVRYVGLLPGETLFPPYGPVLMDLSTALPAFQVGTIPDQTNVLIPAATPTPVDLIFQQVAIDPVTLTGNTSNSVAVTVR